MNNSDAFRIIQNYIRLGFPVFPVHWLSSGICSCGKACKSPGKHPLTQHGFYDASVDEGVIRDWSRRFPKANWAIVTGESSKLVVIDIDSDRGGFDTWTRLLQNHLEPFTTVKVRSGRGGKHIWFQQPGGVRIPCSQGVLGQGIDVRGDGGYILVPPSQTQDSYQFETPLDTTPISEMPGWIIESLTASNHSNIQACNAIVPQGQRHNAIISEGKRMKSRYHSVKDLFQYLKSYYITECEPGDHPVSDDEIAAIASWVMNSGLQHPLTDLGNSERFSKQHKHHARWCEEKGCWLIWNGQYWVTDKDLQIVKYAHDTVRSINDEARNCSENEEFSIKRHALRSESSMRIHAMLDHAKPYMAISMSEFENDPLFINVQNGILDLRTGVLSPHQSDRFFSRIIDTLFDPAAKCFHWERFLTVITGADQDLMDFLQRAVGYSLTGLTDEQCLFFIYGPGKNGKTTFIETLHMIFGDYSIKTDAKLLLEDKNFNDKQYAAQLVGIRFVSANEVADCKRMNETVIKDLTGGDKILARSLYKEPFTFKPSHKLWMYGNNKPQITGQDEGIWRRIRVIPFTVSIPKESTLPQSVLLQQFKEEASGILSWAVRGCLDWQRNGLVIPKSVQEATSEYRYEEDVVQHFIDDVCVSEASGQIEKNELFQLFRAWCYQLGNLEFEQKSQKWFTKQLTRLGFSQQGHGRKFIGGLVARRMV